MLKSRSLLLFLTLTALFSCTGPAPSTDAAQPPAPTTTVVRDDGADTTQPAVPQEDRSTVPFDEKGPRYTWTITPAANNTFGFAIYDHGKLYIDQQKATGLAGPDGWKSKIAARTVAMDALAKLEKGEIPEGLTVVGN